MAYSKADQDRDKAKREVIEARFPDCMRCGAPFRCSGCGTGYGWTKDYAERICYACCADDDLAMMIKHGRATLYLTENNGNHVITNWPGTLRFRVLPGGVHRMRHPFASRALIAYFHGPDGKTWSAKNIGDTQIAHCRRIKG